MARIDAILVSSRSTTVQCVYTSVTPSTNTVRLTLLNQWYGGYTRNTTYEPTTGAWVYGSDNGSFTVSAVQNYRVEWYSTQRDFDRSETVYTNDYSLRIGSGSTISIPTVESSAHKMLFSASGYSDAYLVYAKYIKRYQITFDANGGTPATQTQRVNEDGQVGDLPTATRDGYTFVGWFTDPTGGTQITSTTVPTSATTYYAHWTANTYIAIFDPQGGTISTATDYWKYVTMGQPYGTLPTPTRTGYTFGGWYTASTGGILVTQNTTVETPNDHTLYAHWTAVSVQYTLYFNASGGIVSEASRQVYSGSAYGSLPTPTWNYHTFVGWFTDSYSGTQVNASTIMGEDDAIVYAHWTQDTATVTFNGNGGTPDVPSASYSAGSAYGSLPSATRQYYVLIGWFTAATGGTQITPGDTATSQILYAHWQEQGDPVDGVIWNSNNTDCILENS